MVLCLNCGIKTNNHKFCSLSCRSIYNNRLAKENKLKNIILNKCLFCGKETNNPRFCCPRCSAIYNNTHRTRKDKKTRNCKRCGIVLENNGKIRSRSEYCICCNPNMIDWSKTTLEMLKKRCTLTNYHSFIRELARKSIDITGTCSLCGYSKHTEICHIKPVKEYSVDTPVSLVNSRDNLIELCRNCHWELDHGL